MNSAEKLRRATAAYRAQGAKLDEAMGLLDDARKQRDEFADLAGRALKALSGAVAHRVEQEHTDAILAPSPAEDLPCARCGRQKGEHGSAEHVYNTSCMEYTAEDAGPIQHPGTFCSEHGIVKVCSKCEDAGREPYRENLL